MFNVDPLSSQLEQKSYPALKNVLIIWNKGMKKIVNVMVLGALLAFSGSSLANYYVVKVTANSHDQNHIATNVIDGNNKTRWANKGESWIDFEFNVPQEINSVDVMIYKGNERKQKFALETSMDGKKWRRIFKTWTSGKVKDFERYNFTPITAKYARIIGFGTNVARTWTAFSEISFHSDYKVAALFEK
ncbi:discoidin domain-containing protein [Agarivorans sp. QJM3NY_25]|uniref:discoidin domain-containing protein n=2 Tax=Agarivorans TaxID=261825 RepID=UPI003D7CB72F